MITVTMMIQTKYCCTLALLCKAYNR